MRNVVLLNAACAVSSSALAYGGVHMASLTTMLSLAFVAAVLLVLDGKKRQFE